ncbi:MAG: TolB family protein [Bellilinea sp.]
MKRIAFLLLISTLLLAGCGLDPRVIASSTGEAPTPVVETIQAETPTVKPETAVPTGTQAPEPTSLPTDEPKTLNNMLAYVGSDGNLHLKDLVSGEDTALTEDAVQNAAGDEVSYSSLEWSSDGLLLAYQRLTARSIAAGLEYHFSLWVYAPASGTHTEVLADVQTAGFAWRPGSHMLTFAYTVQEGYFSERATVDAALATGIWGVDVDAGGAPVEIAPPEGGYTVVAPHWSADGRIVAFDEIFGMEGTGYFAYYHMETGQYTRREQQVGGYDLASDGSWLVFDTLTYIASGMERIWRVNLDWTGAQRISPHYGEGYAFFPRLSPDGNQVAYLKGMGMPGETSMDEYEIFVQPTVETNAPQSFGRVLTPMTLEWMPDGASLILTVGAPSDPEIITVSLEDTRVDKLADGSYPAVRP